MEQRNEKQHVIDIKDEQDIQEMIVHEHESPLYKLLVAFVLALLTLSYVRSLVMPVFTVDVTVDVNFEEANTIARGIVPIPTETQSPSVIDDSPEYIITWDEEVLEDDNMVEIPVQAHWPGVAWPTQSASPDDYPDKEEHEEEQDMEFFRLSPLEADDPSFVDEIQFAQTASP